jgi:hypothetical protein
MRFILTILLTAVLGYIAGIFLEWWSIAIVAFLVALLLPQSLGKSFLSGFLGIFLFWGLFSFWISIENNGILAGKIAQLFSLGNAPMLLVLVTAFIGALVGGFAAISGSSLRKKELRIKA